MNEQRPPRLLWKYRPWDEYIEGGIVRGELKFNFPSVLNDPFEFRWRHKFPKEEEAIDEFLRDLLAGEYPTDTLAERRSRFIRAKREAKEYARRHKGRPFPIDFASRIGVLCLTEEFDNLLMWSHYADQHRGVCFGIDTTLLGGKVMRRVNYTDTVPVIDVREYVQGGSPACIDVSLAKCPAWSYEKEWRTVHTQGVHSFPECIKHVIIGAVASQDVVNETRKFAAKCKHKVTVHRARRSNDKFALEVRPPVPRY